VGRRRLVAPPQKKHLLFTREVLLADLFWQREKKLDVVQRDLVLDPQALGFSQPAACRS
jgi:hypothetical protein